MTAQKPQASEPHEAALLLPWFASGTLAREERLLVEAHLRECAECRNELETIMSIRERTPMMFASVPGPSERLHTEVMARVRESRPDVRTEPTQREGTSRRRTLLQLLGASFQQLARPSWAPTLAVLLIIVQAGALSWLTLQPRGPGPGVQTRAIEASAERIRIVFNPRATEQDIRTALIALGSRIVDGPSPEGAYVIELPVVEPALLSQRLRELRTRPGLVEQIENAAP